MPENFDYYWKPPAPVYDPAKAKKLLAEAGFPTVIRPLLRTRIAAGTGVHAYAVDQLLRQMIARAQKLGLRVIEPPSPTIEKLLVMLTMQTAGVAQTGYPKVAL